MSRFVQVFAAGGMKPGQGITQLTANRIDAFTTLAAAYVYGAPYTPMHPLGGIDDQTYIIEDAEIVSLVVDPKSFKDRGRELADRSPGLRNIFTLGPAEFGVDLLAEAARFDPEPLNPKVTEDDVMLIAYTGGTTGRPKGVVHHHRSFVMNVLMTLAEMEWPREIRLLVASPISHAAGYLILPVLLKGGTVVLEPGFDPPVFFEAIERYRITYTFLVPTMIYMLLDHPKLKEMDTSSLELIMYGASPISPTRLKEALEVFGPVFRQGYAQYEAPNTVLGLPKEAHDLAHPERLASCGMPLSGIQVKILDEDGDEADVGEVGEICVRGPLVMQGYWKRPEETEHAFRGGWLHTGDMARRDKDGYFYIVDRTKDMIVSGGFNVYPREIEDVLAEHPAVASAAVIGVPDDKWGEAVKAVVVKKSGAEVAREELIALVREKKGAVYAPKSVDFTDALPLTSLGKLDKKALRAKYWVESERQVH